MRLSDCADRWLRVVAGAFGENAGFRGVLARRGRGLVMVLAGSLAMAGCGVLPPLPDPVPSNVVPSLATLAAPEGADQLNANDIQTLDRMAIRIRNVGCQALSTGSGFAIDKRMIITNKHVVAGAKSLQLLTYDGRDVTAETAATADLADIALVRTAQDLDFAPSLATSDPASGDPVTVIGYPDGGKLTVTTGAVIGATTDPLNENLGQVLVTDAPVEPGSSGSAALNEAGEVIGVVYAKTTTGKSLLVPVSTLRTMLADDSAFSPVPPCN